SHYSVSKSVILRSYTGSGFEGVAHRLFKGYVYFGRVCHLKSFNGCLDFLFTDLSHGCSFPPVQMRSSASVSTAPQSAQMKSPPTQIAQNSSSQLVCVTDRKSVV